MKRCEFYIRVSDRVEKRKGYRYEFGNGCYVHGDMRNQAWYYDTADEYARLVKHAEEREADEQL